jgi:hypothetical protein
MRAFLRCFLGHFSFSSLQDFLLCPAMHPSEAPSTWRLLITMLSARAMSLIIQIEAEFKWKIGESGERGASVSKIFSRRKH